MTEMQRNQGRGDIEARIEQIEETLEGLRIVLAGESLRGIEAALAVLGDKAVPDDKARWGARVLLGGPSAVLEDFPC